MMSDLEYIMRTGKIIEQMLKDDPNRDWAEMVQTSGDQAMKEYEDEQRAAGA